MSLAEVEYIVFKLDPGQLISVGITISGFMYFLFRKLNRLNTLVSGTAKSLNELSSEVSEMKKSLETIATSEVRIEYLESAKEDHEKRIREIENVAQSFGYSYSID